MLVFHELLVQLNYRQLDLYIRVSHELLALQGLYLLAAYSQASLL